MMSLVYDHTAKKLEKIRFEFKPGMVVHTYNLNTWEVESGESGVKGQVRLPNESETCHGSIRVCLKKQTQKYLNSRVFTSILSTTEVY